MQSKEVAVLTEPCFSFLNQNLSKETDLGLSQRRINPISCPDKREVEKCSGLLDTK
jgi:hypothetical protein